MNVRIWGGVFVGHTSPQQRSTQMTIKNSTWLLISLLIITIDQFTKALIRHHIQLGHGVDVTSFFNLVHARNYGAAFSFLDSAGGPQRYLFAAFSLIVTIALTIWLLRLKPNHHWQALALSLIIGGALGNFWGRFSVGHVTDFLDFHWHATHWPAFNVADSAVCVGAILLIITIVRSKP